MGVILHQKLPREQESKKLKQVKIIMTDVKDKRPEDVVWSDKSYRAVFMQTGLRVIKTYKPLAKNNEPYRWVNETEIAPWGIYALGKEQKKNLESD